MFLLLLLTNKDSYNTQIIQCVNDTIFRKRFRVLSFGTGSGTFHQITSILVYMVPRTRTITYGQHSFAVSGPCVWNDLPPTLHASPGTLRQFQSTLKTILFCSALRTWFDLVFSWLFKPLQQHDINLITYLLTYKIEHSVCIAIDTMSLFRAVDQNLSGWQGQSLLAVLHCIWWTIIHAVSISGRQICLSLVTFSFFITCTVLSARILNLQQSVSSDSIIQPQMDWDWFRNVSNLDLVEPNRSGTRYMPAWDCFLLTFWRRVSGIKLPTSPLCCSLPMKVFANPMSTWKSLAGQLSSDMQVFTGLPGLYIWCLFFFGHGV